METKVTKVDEGAADRSRGVARSARAWVVLLAACACLLLNAAGARAQGASQQCQARVRMKTLLDEVRVAQRGTLYIGRLLAECLPEPVRASKTNYGYNPYDGG